jgi:hypothetical protein
LKPGATTRGEIIAHCREHLARFKAPKRVIFGELPKTSTGKIQKFLLREKVKSRRPSIDRGGIMSPRTPRRIPSARRAVIRERAAESGLAPLVLAASSDGVAR